MDWSSLLLAKLAAALIFTCDFIFYLKGHAGPLGSPGSPGRDGEPGPVGEPGDNGKNGPQVRRDKASPDELLA